MTDDGDVTRIVALDGVLFDTLPLRHAALHEAFARIGVHATRPLAPRHLAGRSFAEAARRAGVCDDVAVDLVALDATRRAAAYRAAPDRRDARTDAWALARTADADGRLVLRGDDDAEGYGAQLAMLSEALPNATIVVGGDPFGDASDAAFAPVARLASQYRRIARSHGVSRLAATHATRSLHEATPAVARLGRRLLARAASG